MRIAIEREVAEVLDRLLPSLRGNRFVANVAPQYLSHFDIEKMRSANRHLKQPGFAAGWQHSPKAVDTALRDGGEFPTKSGERDK